jgi:hypothetical protein
VAAVYAIESFHWNNGTTNVFVNKGAKRDTVTSPVAVAEPAKFTSNPPIASQAGGITGVLAQYLVTYPNGPEL